MRIKSKDENKFQMHSRHRIFRYKLTCSTLGSKNDEGCSVETSFSSKPVKTLLGKSVKSKEEIICQKNSFADDVTGYAFYQEK